MSKPLPLEARRRIADACTRFDQACSAGLNPRIEDHIPPEWPPEERGELLKGLLEVEKMRVDGPGHCRYSMRRKRAGNFLGSGRAGAVTRFVRRSGVRHSA